MKKIALISAAVTLAVLVIAPKFVGDNVESQVIDITDALNNHSIYGAEIIEYQKGWFSSTADIALTINVNDIFNAQNGATSAAPTESNPTVMAKLVAHHGPIYVGDSVGIGQAQYSVVLEGEGFREYLQWDQDSPFYRNQGVVGLFGGLSYEDELPAMTASIEEESFYFSFSGYQGKAKSEGDATHFTGLAPTFSFSTAEFTTTVSTLDVAMTSYGSMLAAIKGELLASSSTLSVEKVTIERIEESTVTVNDMVLTTDATLEDDGALANLGMNYTVSSVMADDFEASSLEFGLEFNRLDTDFIKAYQKFNNESLSTPPLEMAAKLTSLIDDHLLSLLAASPELNITHLSGTFPEGDIRAHANTKLVNIDTLPDNLMNPSFWAKHLDAELALDAKEEALVWLTSLYLHNQFQSTVEGASMSDEELRAVAEDQAPGVLDMIVLQGLMVNEEGRYLSTIAVKDGFSTVNGTKVPIPLAQ